MYLVMKVQVDPERITYYIDRNTIYVLENSRNDGIGLVETIRKEIEEVGEKRFVEEFIEWAYDFLEKHDKYIMKYSEILKKESTTYLSKLENVNEKLKDIREKIEKLNNEINSYVKLEYMDIITYRHILSLKLNQELRGEKGRVVSEYIIPIIHSMGLPKLCTDGCESCVVFYRGCNETYLQNYTVSKTLALKFLEILKKKHFPIVGEGLGRILEDLMEKSKKVKIYTPFIDEYGLSLLRKLREKGIDVEVVTRIDDKDNLVFINELQKHNIKVRHYTGHMKIYIFENEKQKICAHGSVNLTRSSFISKGENLTITWDEKEINRVVAFAEETIKS